MRERERKKQNKTKQKKKKKTNSSAVVLNLGFSNLLWAYDHEVDISYYGYFLLLAELALLIIKYYLSFIKCQSLLHIKSITKKNMHLSKKTFHIHWSIKNIVLILIVIYAVIGTMFLWYSSLSI